MPGNPQTDAFDVVITLRMRVPKSGMYVRNGELRVDMLANNAMYVLNREDPNMAYDVEVMGELPGKPAP